MKEFGAKLTLKDKMSATLQKNIKQQKEFSKQVEKTRTSLKGLGKTKTNPVVSLKDKASKAISKIGSGLKTIGKTTATAFVAVKDRATKVLGSVKSMLGTLAKGATITLAVAGGGIMKSLSEGANLQQSKGGVETLFKDDAGTVLANADKAFQTAGLSANAYMETVTSFSASLLQSLGGDTAQSAKIADMAIIDMADNANKMGTSMESIQNAYQGFAKQNYTMLDNLKLGYGGTKEEMQRLISEASKMTSVQKELGITVDGSSMSFDNIAKAISVVQKNMGIMGATKAEAEKTFTGSFASMKASFSNLMGNLSVGDGEAVAKSMGALLKTASTFLFGNMVPMVKTIFSNLPSAISTASQQIAPVIKQNVLPIAKSIKDGIFNALGSMGIKTELIDNIANQFKGMDIGGGIGNLFGGLKNAIVGGANMALSLIPSIISVVKTIAPVVSGIITTVTTTVQGLIPYVVPVIETIKNIILMAMPVIQDIITIACNAITAIMPTVSSIFQFVGDVIGRIVGIIGNHMGLFKTIFSVAVTVVTTVWNTLYPVISKVVTLVLKIVDKLLTGIEKVFNFLAPYISKIWDSICNRFSVASDTIGSVIDLLSGVLGGLYDAVSSIFGSVSGIIASVCDSITTKITGAIDKISGFISKIGNAIDKVNVFNKKDVKTGNKTPKNHAYGLNRVPYDNYPANLHQGEKVLTRVQADQYDNGGVKAVSPVGSKPTEVNTQSTNSIVISKLADSIIVREEADIDNIVNKLVKRLEKVETNVAFV